MMVRYILLICLAGILAPGICFGQGGKKKKKNKNKQSTVEQVDPNLLVKRDMLFVDAATQRMLGDLEKAMMFYEEVLKIDPAHHATHYEKSKIHLEQRSYTEAIASAKTALKGDPSNYWYHMQLMEVYKDQGDFTRAIEVGDKAAKAFPNQKGQYKRLADLCVRNQLYVQAINYYKQAAAGRGGDMESLHDAAYWEIETGEFDAADKTIDKLIELAPNEPEGYALKVEVLGLLGRDSEAKATLENWVKTDPANGKAKMALAKISNQEEAIRLLREAYVDESISLEEKLEALDHVKTKKGQVKVGALLPLLVLLKEQYGKNADIDIRAGELYLLDKNYSKAAATLREALKASPANEGAWESLMFADLAGNDFAALKNDVEEARDLYPNSRSLVAFYALYGIRAGDDEIADYAMGKLFKMGLHDNAASQAALLAWQEKGKSLDEESINSESIDFLDALKKAYTDAKSTDSQVHADGKVLSLFTALLAQNELLGLDPEFLTLYGHAAQKAGNLEMAGKIWDKAKKYGAKDPENAL